ncbi:hypothetical protein E1B28_008514 [Marasmius oreades]|nr:uncharacterized protein E1B28_008514 [Marasmius oreades]KAG7092141.1 hypothetical protein E1B28_008514 [Marasmius oreades]
MQASASAIPFHETVQAVIYNHRSLLASVALILSSKGYAAILSPLLLPIILRVNSPESMKEFLKEYEKLNELYHRGTAADQGSNSKQHIPMEMHLMLSKKSIRECAIRALAVIGHLELAVNLIPTMDQEVVLDRRTYGFLLTHLKRRRSLLVEQPIFDPKKLTKVNSFTARVQRIYDEASYGHNATTTEMSLLHGQERFPIVNSELTTTSELANAIRRAKFGLPFNTGRLRESRRFPNQRILFQVISALSSPDVVLTTPSGAQETVALSRPRLLRLLRRRALYSTYVPSKMWLFMEMVYLWRSKRYEAVIKLFGTFFWSFGVPIEEINPIVRLADDLLSMESLPEFFNGNPSKGILPKGKLYPSSEQTSLVWQSLVMVHSGDKVKVVALYKKMMAFARTYHEASKQLHVNAETENPSLDTPYVLPPGLDPEADDSPSLPLVSLEHPLISAETYTPFIAQLSPGRKRPVLRRSDLFPSQIIRDMTTLGLRPTVYHFTELARGYALVGERTKALKVLDHLEAAHPVQASQEDTSELSGSSFEDVTSVNKERKDGLPLPDLVLYIALMRSFIMARDLEGVAEVDGKMKSRYGSMRDMQTRNEKEKVGSVKENLDYLEEVYRDWHSMEVARQLE